MKERVENLKDFMERVILFWPRDQEGKFIDQEYAKIFIMFQRNKQDRIKEKDVDTILLTDIALLSFATDDRTIYWQDIHKQTKIPLDQPEPNKTKLLEEHVAASKDLEKKLRDWILEAFPEAKLINGVVE